MMALAVAVHWVHVLGAIVWAGSQIFLFAALWPALLGRPASEARALLGALMPGVARIMGPAGIITILSGLVRGTAFGPIRSLAALTTPYGLTFLASLLLVAALTVRGGRLRSRMGPSVFGEGAFPDRARPFLRRQGTITLSGVALLLVGMVLMRFGL
jgi:uncharacterized membrane protein